MRNNISYNGLFGLSRGIYLVKRCIIELDMKTEINLRRSRDARNNSSWETIPHEDIIYEDLAAR